MDLKKTEKLCQVKICLNLYREEKSIVERKINTSQKLVDEVPEIQKQITLWQKTHHDYLNFLRSTSSSSPGSTVKMDAIKVQNCGELLEDVKNRHLDLLNQLTPIKDGLATFVQGLEHKERLILRANTARQYKNISFETEPTPPSIKSIQVQNGMNIETVHDKDSSLVTKIKQFMETQWEELRNLMD